MISWQLGYREKRILQETSQISNINDPCPPKNRKQSTPLATPNTTTALVFPRQVIGSVVAARIVAAADWPSPGSEAQSAARSSVMCSGKSWLSATALRHAPVIPPPRKVAAHT